MVMALIFLGDVWEQRCMCGRQKISLYIYTVVILFFGLWMFMTLDCSGFIEHIKNIDTRLLWFYTHLFVFILLKIGNCCRSALPDALVQLKNEHYMLLSSWLTYIGIKKNSWRLKEMFEKVKSMLKYIVWNTDTLHTSMLACFCTCVLHLWIQLSLNKKDQITAALNLLLYQKSRFPAVVLCPLMYCL